MTSLTRRVARAAALTAAVTGLGGVSPLGALAGGWWPPAPGGTPLLRSGWRARLPGS